MYLFLLTTNKGVVHRNNQNVMKKVQSISVLILSESDFKTMGKWGKGFDFYEGNSKDSLIDVFSGGYYYHPEWDFGFQIVEKPNGDYEVTTSSVFQRLIDGEFPVAECISLGYSEKEIHKEFLKFLRDGIKQTYKEYTIGCDFSQMVNLINNK
jgi:hypothetical protein